MESGPTNPQRRPEEVEDYFLFVDILHTTDEEKELLKSLIMNKRPGKLELFLEGDHEELEIDPSKSDEKLADEISEAVEKVHGDRNPVQVPETMLRVVFTPTVLH